MATQAEPTTEERLIRRACFDPGAFVKREFADSGYGDGVTDPEPLYAWQARAVVEALARGEDEARDGEPSILNGVVFDVIVERVVRSDPSSDWRVEVRMGGELLGSGSGTSYADGLLTALAAMGGWLQRNEQT